MQPLGTKVYLLKRYSPNDSFCTFFFSESAIEKDAFKNQMVYMASTSRCY